MLTIDTSTAHFSTALYSSGRGSNFVQDRSHHLAVCQKNSGIYQREHDYPERFLIPTSRPSSHLSDW